MSKYEIELDQLLIDSFANCSTIDEIYECDSYKAIHQAIIKAKAFDVIKPFINVIEKNMPSYINPYSNKDYHAIRLIMDCATEDENQINLIKQALEVDEDV